MPTAGIPRAFDAFRSLSRSQKDLLQGSVKIVPLAEASSILEEHADHLGLHLQNTRYIAPKVSCNISPVHTGHFKAGFRCIPAVPVTWTPT